MRDRMHPLLSTLTGGDRRSIRRADEVVSEVIENPALFDMLFNEMLVMIRWCECAVPML